MSHANLRCKRVGQSLYIHRSQTDRVNEDAHRLIKAAVEISPEAEYLFNVVKLEEGSEKVTLLQYEDLEAAPFPSLLRYWSVSVIRKKVLFRSYETSLNPPILHRKELLLPKDHPKIVEFEALTRQAEEIGLFQNPHRIGFRAAWTHLLETSGYALEGHQLVPIANACSAAPDEVQLSLEGEIARHKTALVRYGFSAPIQTLARFGLLDGSLTVFDYGCGRGDDLRGLRENGIEASGWDPHYSPDTEISPADIVNLGFVVNVIESREERDQALSRAYSLAKRVLVVSAMLSGEGAISGKPFGDGILTARGTFQKYFTQASLKEYISEVLGEEPIAASPGVFFVFSDKNAEQLFLYSRQKSRRNLLRNAERSRLHRGTAADRRVALYEAHKQLVDDLWHSLLVLGRDPEPDELPRQTDLIEIFGSHLKAIRFAKSIYDDDLERLDESRRLRSDDLLVYLARLLFDRRKPYKDLAIGIRHDVKAFFGDFKEAVHQAKDLLFRLQDLDQIFSSCQMAQRDGLGWFDHEDAYYVQARQVEQLPAIVRAYVNCGLVLYGDLSNVDLIKVHIRTSKLSLMSYDGFDAELLPRLARRTKINLRNLDFDEFVYGDLYPKTYLYRKSRFMNEEDSSYGEQIHFEETLERLGLMPPDTEHGPPMGEFDQALASYRYVVSGGTFSRAQTIPKLDEQCGRNFRFMDLIECGETQQQAQIDNRPVQAESYSALVDLALYVLDPVIDYFGMVELTYGFCSHRLSLLVPGRNDPRLDQHSAHERNSRGRLICSRGGAAADFLVLDEDMFEVARWITENCSFDRLYFYGKDRPIHVSYSPAESRQVFDLSMKTEKGWRFPQALRFDSTPEQ